ncbi:DNA recombination protein RmuC [Balneolaceae bacterium ANBcel3]|nr:DNA recombination protein RmuC [Balneolaceae bacterium ANBcel3]
MTLSFVFFFLFGLTTGGLAVFLYLRTELRRHTEKMEHLASEHLSQREEMSRLEERNSSLNDRIKQLESDKKSLEEESRTQLEKLSETKTTNTHLVEKLESFKGEVEEIQTAFKHQFKVLANEILEEKSKRFTEQNKVSLEQLLNPLGEKIVTFEKKVEDTYNSDLRDRISLKEQISQLSELNTKMSKEAENLTRALKGESKSQGKWGEVILERILEKSGLQKNREYQIQASFSGEGKRQQPDVIIHLPDNRHLVIDSKVSLTAYERFVSMEDEDNQKKALKEHIESTRRHIRELSQKNYHQIYDINSPDFVLMFLPVEPAFGLAIQHEPGLYNEAFDKNIVMVSPSTLLATLATISNIWKQEYQNRNALEIADASGRLYDKFVGLAEDLLKLGDRMKQASDSYDKAMNKLQTGHGNLLNRVEHIRKLGANANKKLPASLKGEEDELNTDR